MHVPPSKRKLEDGDILTLDMGLKWRGWYLDMARTIPIGKISKEKSDLILATKEALDLGIKQAKVGNRLGDIGHAVQTYLEERKYGVVRQLCGHGIGRNLHEKPDIPNFGQRHKGETLKPGMVLAIEPMAVIGDPGIKKGPDGFCCQTSDNSWSAHFEHTILITDGSPEILTKI